MVVGQGVTSRFFDFGVVGRCFKQRWGHLGGVFSELGVRGGRIQKWSYEVAVNRGGGVNFTDYEKYKRSRSGDVKLKTNEPLTSPFNACA